MAEQAKSSGTSGRSAFEDTTSDVLKFRPSAVMRTLVEVYKACSTSNHSLLDAISYQEWEGVLSPVKYLFAVVGTMSLIAWLGLGEAQQRSDDVLLSPEWLKVIIAGIATAIPLHFLLGMGRQSEGRITGIEDGITKLVQFYVFLMTTILINIFIPLFASVWQYRMNYFLSWTNNMFMEILVAIVLVSAILASVCAVQLISKLYGVTKTRVMGSIAVIFVMGYALFSTIARGNLFPQN